MELWREFYKEWILVDCDKRKDLRQPLSSELSPQSFTLSHTAYLVIHLPLSHLNWPKNEKKCREYKTAWLQVEGAGTNRIFCAKCCCIEMITKNEKKTFEIKWYVIQLKQYQNCRSQTSHSKFDNFFLWIFDTFAEFLGHFRTLFGGFYEILWDNFKNSNFYDALWLYDRVARLNRSNLGMSKLCKLQIAKWREISFD